MEQLQHLTSRSQLAVAGGGTDRLLLSVEVKQTSVTQALGIQRDGWTRKAKTKKKHLAAFQALPNLWALVNRVKG